MSVICLLAVLLVACADDNGGDADRRFANQPVTEPVETIAAPTASPVVTDPPPTDASASSPASLLDVRGAPAVVYALVDGEVLAIDTADPGNGLWMPVDPALDVVDIASSPSGDRVALLELPIATDEPAAMVVVRQQDGTESARWVVNLPPATPVATPEEDDAPVTPSVASITWSADGTSLLVIGPADSLVSIDLDGDAQSVLLPENVSNISGAAWSPAGDRIALISRDQAGSGRIMVFDPEQPSALATQVVPPTADTAGQGSVTQFSWLPNGSGFVYIMADEGRDPVAGGSLYTQVLRTGERRLVATPGRGGPAAVIADFAVSPDGKVIAYTIVTPNDDDWVFNSLWVRSLKGSAAMEVSVPDAAPVEAMWWVDSGLAWRHGGEVDRFVLDGPGGELQDLLVVAPGTSATPVVVGTPAAATPLLDATPIEDGTPGSGSRTTATPVASPQVTPLASPTGVVHVTTSTAATPDLATPAD